MILIHLPEHKIIRANIDGFTAELTFATSAGADQFFRDNYDEIITCRASETFDTEFQPTLTLTKHNQP